MYYLKNNLIFTSYGIDEINQKISQDLDLIVEEIVNLLGIKNISSIILSGSFGKGEGSAYYLNNKIKVVNDYDITIVHPYGLMFKIKNKKKIIILAEKLSKTINIKQIDLNIISIKDINIVKNKLSYFDLFYKHVVLYGNSPFLNISDNVDIKIPIEEGTWLLRNRGIGLILSGLYFIGKMDNSLINRENFWIECNKAKLAIGDSFLISRGLYHYSIKERLKRVKRIHKKENLDFFDWYEDAVNFKICFNKDFYPSNLDDMINEWFCIKNSYNKYFLDFENDRLSKSYINWNSYYYDRIKDKYYLKIKFWYDLLFSDFKNNKSKILSSKLKNCNNLSILITGLLLDAVYSRWDIKNIDLIKSIFKFDISNYSDIDTWNKISKFYLLSIHPEGEAKKVAFNEKL